MLASETRRKYVHVGSGPASLRATVSEASIAIHVRRISQCPAPFSVKAGTLRIKGDNNDADCAN